MIRNNYSIHKGNISKSLPGKRLAGGEFFKKSIESYWEKCWDSIVNTFDISKLKCFVIGGPGTARETFHKWLKEEKSQQKDQNFMKKEFTKF